MPKTKLICSLAIFSLIFYGCEEIFDDDLNDEVINLVAPTNEVVTTEGEHQFTWERLSALSAYQLQIVTPRFDSIAVMVVDTVTVDNLVRVSLSRGRQYQWRVRAVNTSYSSPYSDPWTLTIQ